MKEIVNLMDYRSSIKVVDATLRDGGLVNDFYFTDEFVKALYEANIRAGVDYMEMGYKASKEMFDENKFGKWKFCDDDDIREIVGDNDTSLKIAVMADVGRCDYKKDIVSRSESPIDLIRVATYLNTIPAAADMIEDAKKKGYEVSCNIMAISSGQESDLRVALDILEKHQWTYFISLTVLVLCTRSRLRVLRILIWSLQASMGKSLASMRTTISSLHLPIQLRLLVTVWTGSMPHTRVWEEAQAIVQWNCCLDFCAIRSTTTIM